VRSCGRGGASRRPGRHRATGDGIPSTTSRSACAIASRRWTPHARPFDPAWKSSPSEDPPVCVFGAGERRTSSRGTGTSSPLNRSHQGHGISRSLWKNEWGVSGRRSVGIMEYVRERSFHVRGTTECRVDAEPAFERLSGGGQARAVGVNPLPWAAVYPSRLGGGREDRDADAIELRDIRNPRHARLLEEGRKIPQASPAKPGAGTSLRVGRLRRRSSQPRNNTGDERKPQSCRFRTQETRSLGRLFGKNRARILRKRRTVRRKTNAAYQGTGAEEG
jgi:hypothetical protein